MALLQILNGKSAETTLELPEKQVLEVGTKRKAFLRLRDAGISYVHAQLELLGDTLKVTDCKSQAGTFFGDEPIVDGMIELKHDQVFRVGTTEIKFLLQLPATQAPTIEAPRKPSVDPKVINELKAENQRLQGDLKSVRSQSETLSFERDKLKSALEEVRGQLVEAEEIASDTVETANELEQANKSLAEEIEDLKSSQRNEAEAKLAELEQQNAELQEEIDTLAKEVQSLSNELHENRKESGTYQARLNALEAELKESQDKAINEVEEGQRKLDKANKSRDQAQDQRDKALSEVQALAAEEKHLRAELSSVKTQYESQKQQVDALESSLTETTREAILTEIRNQELSGRGCDTIANGDVNEAAQISEALLAVLSANIDLSNVDDGVSLASIRAEVAATKGE